MAARRADRRHAGAVEALIEARAQLDECRDIDRRGDEARRRRWTFFRALRDGLREIVTAIPGGRRIWALLGGLFDALRTEDALDSLEDRKVQLAIAALDEAAGLVDGVDLRLPVTA